MKYVFICCLRRSSDCEQELCQLLTGDPFSDTNSQEDCIYKPALLEQDHWQQNGVLVSKETIIMCAKGEAHSLTEGFFPHCKP